MDGILVNCFGKAVARVIRPNPRLYTSLVVRTNHMATCCSQRTCRGIRPFWWAVHLRGCNLWFKTPFSQPTKPPFSSSQPRSPGLYTTLYHAAAYRTVGLSGPLRMAGVKLWT